VGERGVRVQSVGRISVSPSTAMRDVVGRSDKNALDGGEDTATVRDGVRQTNAIKRGMNSRMAIGYPWVMG